MIALGLYALYPILEALDRVFCSGELVQHFKGMRYLIIDIAEHVDSGKKLVIYKALYGNGDIWLRPKYMFNEYVIVDGKPVKRFQFIK